MQGKNKETEVTEQLLQVTVLLLLQLHNNDIYYHKGADKRQFHQPISNVLM